MDITRKSLISGITRTRSLDITSEQWAAFDGGAHIQNAMPHLTDGDPHNNEQGNLRIVKEKP